MLQKVRRAKPEVEASFNFLPDLDKRRQARDATLSVLNVLEVIQINLIYLSPKTLV